MNKITTARSLPAAFGLSRPRSAFHGTRSGGTGVAPSMTRGSEEIGMAVGRAWYERGIGCERRRWWRESGMRRARGWPHNTLHNCIDVIGRRLLNVGDLRASQHNLFVEFLFLQLLDCVT